MIALDGRVSLISSFFVKESLNGKLKTFKCIDSRRFRHSEEKFKMCFEAVAVLTQCKMELGDPVFDI